MAKNLLNFPFKFQDACDICALSKQCCLPFSASSISSIRPFELIHCDIWGPYKIHSLSGAKYFLTIVDDYSRFTWVFFMHHKHETQNLLINFFSFVKTQFNASIANIRIDNGGGNFFLCRIFSTNMAQLINTLAFIRPNKMGSSSVNIVISLSLHVLFVFKLISLCIFGQNASLLLSI
jgi:hypothetical protein